MITLILWIVLPSCLLAGAGTNTYEYDDLNRLTVAVLDGSRIEYTYDAAGNITQVLTPYAIGADKIGTGNGAISDNLGKLECGDDCQGTYDLNTIVKLTATPDGLSFFDGWSGACTGTSTCIVTVDEVESVTASFVPMGADLTVSKTDGLSEAIPGNEIEYTVVVSNNGPSSVNGALVEDTLPAELTCSWTSEAMGSASGSAGSGTGNLSETVDLPAGSSMSYTFICDIDPAATATLSNTASVTTGVPDPVAGNESALDETALAPQADLALTKTASSEEAGVGAPMTYTLEVSNSGPSTAAELTVVDVLPAGTGFVSASGTDWTCGEDSGTVTCGRAALSPSGATTLELVVTMPPQEGSVVNSATVSASTPEAAAGDETGEATVDVFGSPRILQVRSVATTESGELVSESSTEAALTQLYLVASHDLANPAGDSDPVDVTNPAAYRLFQTDLGGTFDATSCTDPSDVVINSATYEEAEAETIVLRLAAPLAQGLYRLQVCASGAALIEDVFGSPLDGDADGLGGDDFVLDFRVLVTNLFDNPNFDEGLGGWEIVSGRAGDVTYDATQDTSSAPTSGSVRFENLSGIGSAVAIHQCFDLSAGEVYFVAGQARSSSLTAEFPEIQVDVETFGSNGCSGASIDTAAFPGPVGDTGDAWLPAWNALFEVPAGAASARVTFVVLGDELAATAWIDDVRFHFLGLFIFFDNFESGDSNRWDSTVP